MNKELKVCPFCGGRDTALTHYKLSDGTWSIECLEDKCGVKIDGFADKDKAIKAWNTRVPTLEEDNE